MGNLQLDSGGKDTFFVLRVEPFSTLGAQGVSLEIARHAGWIKVRRLGLKAAHKMVQKIQNNYKKVLQTAKHAPCVITAIQFLWESGVTSLVNRQPTGQIKYHWKEYFLLPLLVCEREAKVERGGLTIKKRVEIRLHRC